MTFSVNMAASTAARLRDEIKRLQETELAVADDPFARQSEVDARVADQTGVKKEAAPRKLKRRRKGP